MKLIDLLNRIGDIDDKNGTNFLGGILVLFPLILIIFMILWLK